MIKAKILITVLSVLLVIFLFPGCAVEPVSIESITLCQNVDDSSYAPIDPTEIFPSGTTAIYISVKINNMTPEDKLTIKWNYLETSDKLETINLTTDETGSGYKVSHILSPNGFPRGNYNVEVYLNDELYEIKDFSVE